MPAGIDTAKPPLAGRRVIIAEVNKAGQTTPYHADISQELENPFCNVPNEIP